MGRRDLWWPLLFVVAIGVTGVEIGVLRTAGVGQHATWANWADAWWVVLPAMPIGWSYVAIGWYAWRRRPDNRVGVLMTAVGLGELASGLWMVPHSLVHTIGLAVADWFLALLVHLLLAFPSGRLSGRTDRSLVVAGYLTVLPANAVLLAFADAPGAPGARDLFLIDTDPAAAEVLSITSGVLVVGLLAATAVVLVRRLRRGTSTQRRALGPVLVTGVVAAVMAGLRLATDGVGLEWPLLAFVAIPYAFLAGLVRIRFFQLHALGRLVTELSDAADLHTALASALHDADAQVVYWLADEYVDDDGRPVLPPAENAGRALVPIERDGRRVGALIVDAALVADRSPLVTSLTRAVQLAMDNQRLHTELRARIGELERSRADIVRAGDLQRRQLERDLHDGAQQLLVTVRLRLGLIRQFLSARSTSGRSRVGRAPLREVGAYVDTALSDLDVALAELRDLSHGLHPAVLATRGLAEAVRSLAERTPLPVGVIARVRLPLPDAVASAAYFVVAESLTNVTKHAAATSATVTVAQHADRLLVEVRDDGVGGAVVTGPGLRGLTARVAALDGHLEVVELTGGGTAVRAQIPLAER